MNLASEPVQFWLASLPPETKKRVRVALRDLANGKGDIKALHSELAGWSRLCVDRLHIVYRSLPGKISDSTTPTRGTWFMKMSCTVWLLN